MTRRLRALCCLIELPYHTLHALHRMHQPNAVQAWRWAWRRWVHEEWHRRPRESFGGWEREDD